MNSKFFIKNQLGQKGFNLIELMVTVVIIGILSAIAIPAYSDYVIRGKIPDATSILAAKRVQMEQWFQDNKTYVGGTACSSDAGSSKYFTFDCAGAYGVAGTASVYTIEAVGTGTMAGFNYTIDQAGTKTSTIVSPASSKWIANQPTCWITKSGGIC
ncbi:MAG: type IV pilin protein [Burkholderiaceae bacterium]